MAYDDKDEGRVFPTRTGVATGSANERTMLDVVGAGGIRTQNRDIVGPEGQKGTVRLRTRGGAPEFVTEFEPSDQQDTPVYMDSGVVDLLSVNPNDVRSILPAPLFYGAIQRAYASAKKLLGTIIPPLVSAKSPPAEGVAGKSFDYSVDMTSKKECAAKCPASMFTGKARLYVQAQYGAPSKLWKWALDIQEGIPPRLVHSNGFILDTNTGIYRDAKYRHWFVDAHVSGVLITKIVRDASVEPLVKLLRDQSYKADWDKIEAYILAYSFPESSIQVPIDVSGMPAPFMLGYGWKFNWPGDAADIIRHEEGSPMHTSTHFRLSIYRDTTLVFGQGIPSIDAETNRWRVTLSVVSGPHHWHNTQFSQVISYPSWLTECLWIFGTKIGDPKGDDVPVYCFYNNSNALELFTYTASGGESVGMYSRTSYPATWGITCDWTTDAWVGMNATVYDTFSTFFTDGGGSEWRVRTNNPESTGFSCSYGTTVSATQQYSYQKRTTAGKIINNTGVSWGGYGWEEAHGSSQSVAIPSYKYGGTPFVLSDGVVAEIGGGPGSGYVYDYETWPPGLYQSAFVCFHQVVGLAYDEGVHSENFQTLIVVPFMDAEAAYVTGDIEVSRISSGWSGDGNPTTDNVWGYPLRVQGGNEATIGRFHSDSWGLATVGFSEYTDQVNTTSTTILAKLVTKSGGFAFYPPVSLSPFFSGQPLVQQQFITHSAAVGAAAYGFGARNLEGFPNTFTEPPPFIGWA